jgi:hypothetical protein
MAGPATSARQVRPAQLAEPFRCRQAHGHDAPATMETQAHVELPGPLAGRRQAGWEDGAVMSEVPQAGLAAIILPARIALARSASCP